MKVFYLSTNSDEISTSKRYLTSKLVEDSLKWQRDKRTSQNRGSSAFGVESKSPSPFSSPVHRGAVANTVHAPLQLRIPRPQKLIVSSSSQGNNVSEFIFYCLNRIPFPHFYRKFPNLPSTSSCIICEFF